MIRIAAIAAPIALLAACGQAADDTGGGTGDAAAGISAPASSNAASSPPAAFAQCATCHRVEPGANSIGPSLAGAFGARAGHVGDYAYSPAMRAAGLTWDEPTLDRFLAAPLETVPGTRMAFSGIKDPAQRQAVIAYLKTL
jgi:cytochrome c2